MATAGAPPPPPPPPPPTPPRTLSDLPTELFLEIISLLSTTEYVAFALAVYPVLRRRGLVPPLTGDLYRELVTEPATVEEQMEPSHWRLPPELTSHIVSFLGPVDMIRFLFMHRRFFWGRYLPRLSKETTEFMGKQRERDK